MKQWDDVIVEILMAHEDTIVVVCATILVGLLIWNPTDVDFYKDVRLWSEIFKDLSGG